MFGHTTLHYSDAQRSPGPRFGNARGIHWRAAFLGAAVGIAGPAYVGTLLNNLLLWIEYVPASDTTMQYAPFAVSWQLLVHALTVSVFALACGWVSAALGRGAPLRNALAAGLITVSFPLIMLVNLQPADTAHEDIAIALTVSLGLPLLGSLLGALAYARK